MYMKNVMYKIIMGCYIVAALVLVAACNDSLDIQQAYPFSIETLPVPKKLKVGETAEIRCQLVRGGYYQPTTYQIGISSRTAKGTQPCREQTPHVSASSKILRSIRLIGSLKTTVIV